MSPITDKQRKSRRGRIGASDVPALLGQDRWRTAYDIYLDKTGQLTEQQPNEAMLAGTYFEDGVLAWAEDILGPITRNQLRVAKDLDFPIGASVDAIVNATGEPVQAKTAGLFSPLSPDWGEPNTDQVPFYVLLQVQTEMLVTGSQVCHIPAFLGGKGFCMFTVPRSDPLINKIIEEGRKFWQCVQSQQPPTTSLPNLQTLKRLVREPEKIVNVDANLVSKWRLAKSAKKAVDDSIKQAERELLAALDDAEVGQCEIGAITFLEQHRKAYTVKPASYRVLRFKASDNEKELTNGKSDSTNHREIEQVNGDGQGAGYVEGGVAASHDSGQGGEDGSAGVLAPA